MASTEMSMTDAAAMLLMPSTVTEFEVGTDVVVIIACPPEVCTLPSPSFSCHRVVPLAVPAGVAVKAAVAPPTQSDVGIPEIVGPGLMVTLKVETGLLTHVVTEFLTVNVPMAYEPAGAVAGNINDKGEVGSEAFATSVIDVLA